jgi:Fur family ferric uptake transcriptional regulator
LLSTKFRITPQRKAILEELRKADSHLTADEVYELVRARMPRISLGTVYRNLEILSRLGMIRRLESGGAPRRFDGKTNDHYHLRCLRCGRVDDAPIARQTALEESIQGLTDYEIIGHQLEFIGLCLTCREKPGRVTQKGLR